MKASELAGMSDEQLSLSLAETEKHLFQLRFQSATDRLETPSELLKARKDIARIKTEQRKRELTRLKAATDDQLAGLLTGLQPKTDGPGKRRAKRAIARVTAIVEGRKPAIKVKRPTRGKGEAMAAKQAAKLAKKTKK